ncbi:HlyD family type I secretion periplasmic adaptor subunit [Novosphingobium sp. 9]|uniref:HlyD family type I secretion periplasmic adaptor subunit n=1 Tax=Novosphingobium sp. 9 TaxID=2025349 RepID=UPI0021B6A36C|nr:HlyD family type I secretion periplasmic adaptor subunit [Novosphingobium sp. 9]
MAHLEDISDRIRPRAASNLLLWSVAAFFVIAILWACFTQLDRTVHGEGRVIPAAHLQTISNLEGGIVSAILVHAGEDVKQGAALLRLDRTASASDYGTGQATVEALSLKVARLEAEVAGRTPQFPKTDDPAMQGQIALEQSLYTTRQADLAQTLSAASARVAQAQHAIAEADATHAAKLSARDSARQQAEMLRPLVQRGIEPRMSLVQADNAAAVATGEAAAASASAATARAALAEANAQLAQARQDWRAKAGDELTSARAEMEARSRGLPALQDKVKRTLVRAPLDGRINRVLVTTVGGTVKPGDPLLEIVPSDGSLMIEATVKPEDIAFVRIGQRALVKITAYDYAVYGGLEGEVVGISPDATVNERTGESRYTVRVRADGRGLRSPQGRRWPLVRAWSLTSI